MPDRTALDPDLTLVAGISPEGVPYVGVTLQIDGQPQFCCDAIPEWLLFKWNDAAARAKQKVA